MYTHPRRSRESESPVVGCLPDDWLFDISSGGGGGADLADQLAGCDDVDELLRLLRLQPPSDYVPSSGGSSGGSLSDVEGLPGDCVIDSDSVRQSDRGRSGICCRSGSDRHHGMSNRSRWHSADSATDEDFVGRSGAQAETHSDRQVGVRALSDRLSDRLPESNSTHAAEQATPRFLSRVNGSGSESDDGIEISRVSFSADHSVKTPPQGASHQVCYWEGNVIIRLTA